MKGIQNYYGKNQLEFVLVNNGGHNIRTVASAHNCIKRYNMEAYPRVRYDRGEFNKKVIATFGHHSYGQIVIDKNGRLLAVNANEWDLEKLIKKACAAPGSNLEHEGLKVTTKVKDQKGGREGLLNLSNRLTSDLTAKVTVKLSLPDGWIVSNDLTNTTLATYLSHEFLNNFNAGAVTAKGGKGIVEFHFPIRAKKGLVIGDYFIHGKIKFQPSRESGPLAPVEIPWHTVIKAM